MRQGQQHRRGRGRNNNNNNNQSHHAGNRKGQNPLTRSFESNGPDVKVRGTPAHVAEKYLQLARDAQSSGDHVLAENYLQHAEHYNRIILAYREQQIQQGGEGYNGNGRSHQPMPRSDVFDGDEGQGDDGIAGADDRLTSDQPPYVRQPGAEQPPTNEIEGGMDMPPRITQRPGEHPPRFRDRHQRHERHDRQDRGDRQGYDRQDRGHSDRSPRDGFEGAPRGERHERFDRSERSGDRGFDRQRDRQFRSHDQQAEGGEMQHAREPREPREQREPRHAPRDYGRDSVPRDFSRDLPRDVPRDPAPDLAVAPAVPLPAPVDVAPPPVAQSDAPARTEGSPRRRERFGLGQDQPEFLRRPVRRPRREPEAGFVPETPVPPAEDPPRD